jgi:MinD superfamily P-loop ATPase
MLRRNIPILCGVGGGGGHGIVSDLDLNSAVIRLVLTDVETPNFSVILIIFYSIRWNFA